MTALAVWAMWGGVALGVAAFALLLRALFADRSRGRRRCPKCWYLMDGVVTEGGLRCPECGHAAKSVRALHRTKRRWGWAALACLLGVVAYGVAVTPRVVEGGWRRAVPSTLLVSVWPMDVEAWVGMHLRQQTVNDALLDELDRRVEEEELTRWQERWWVARVERWVKAHGRLGIEEERPVIAKLKAAEVNWTFDAEPLEAVMERLSREIGVPVRVDWDALVAEGVRPEGLVSGRLEGLDGLEAVEGVAEACRDARSPVAWRVEGDGVSVGVFGAGGNQVPLCVYGLGALIDRRHWRSELVPPPPLDTGSLIHSDYSVFDVPTPEERVERITLVLKNIVDPEEWVDHGGIEHSMAVVGTHLLVRAGANTQHAIAAAIDAILRAGRRAGGTTSVDEAAWNEFTAAHNRLVASKITLRAGPVSLSELLEKVAQESGVPFRTDWEGLAHVLIWPEMPMESFSGLLNAAQVLDRFVERLNFDEVDGASWTIRDGAVKVQRDSDTDALTIVRVYNVDDLRRDEFDPGYFLDDLWPVITAMVDPDGWIDGGGDTGWIQVVEASMVVWNTPRNHLAIEHLLATLRAGPPKRAMSTPATEPEHEEE